MTIPVKPAGAATELQALSRAAGAEQRRLGYADTLREIMQQPATWRDTSALLDTAAVREVLQAVLAERPGHIVLTGSGSSLYVGDCLAPLLQAELGIPCQAIAAGTVLTHRRSVLPAGRGLLVSIARSGDSPESTGVVDQLLAEVPDYRHLVLTCNARGALATRYADDARLRVLHLDDATNDRSLVMTSSFTNLLLAGSGLAHAGRGGGLPAVSAAAELAERVLGRYGDALAALARSHPASAVYLGSGPAIGAARESALKMLEMSGGSVGVMAETFLGLRHGPMSRLNEPGLVVAFLSSAPSVRGYELDLLRELSAKGLGRARLLVGETIPAQVVGDAGLAVELPGFDRLSPAGQLVVQVLVGQLLAFFRCLHLGHAPDAPSQGVLTRVVESFAIHGAGVDG